MEIVHFRSSAKLGHIFGLEFNTGAVRHRAILDGSHVRGKEQKQNGE